MLTALTSPSTAPGLTVRTKKRGGRAVKIYRASAERFLVPFARTNAATLVELFYKTDAPKAQRFARNLAEAVLITPKRRWVIYLVATRAVRWMHTFRQTGEHILSLLEPAAPAADRS